MAVAAPLGFAGTWDLPGWMDGAWGSNVPDMLASLLGMANIGTMAFIGMALTLLIDCKHNSKLICVTGVTLQGVALRLLYGSIGDKHMAADAVWMLLLVAVAR